MDTEAVSVVYGIGSSLVTAGVIYGILKAKVEHLEKVIDRKVDLDVFKATMEPIHQDLSEMRNDLKELLKTVQRHDTLNSHN